MKQPETPEEIAAYETWTRAQVASSEEKAAYVSRMMADIKAIESGEVPDGFAGLIRSSKKDALKEAGDVIECYHKNTGIDLGAASMMPFYDDTMSKIDNLLKETDK